jgi:hypothetical protein
MALKTPHVMKTPTQMVVKIRLRHREFGTTAGLPSRSCRPTQYMKHGIKARDIMSVERVAGCLMLDPLSLIKL